MENLKLSCDMKNIYLLKNQAWEIVQNKPENYF